MHRLRVVARADARFRSVAGYRDRVGEVIDSASDQLAARFGVELDLLRVEDWNPGDAVDAEQLLERLATEVPGDEVDLVIGFSAAPPPRRARMSDLAYGRYLGRFVVLRSLTPYFRPEQGRALHDGEVLAALHGIGRVLGALPVCGAAVMSERVGFRERDPAAWQWSPSNLALVRLHATLDLRAGGTRLPVDVARRSLEVLASAPPAITQCGETVTLRRALWTEVAGAVSAEPRADGDAVTEGRAALAAGDAATALARCGPVAEVAPASEAASCAADAALALDDTERATRYLRAHLAHHPDDEGAVLRLAKLVGRSGDDGAARGLLRRFVESHPDHLRARVNLGVALARLGDYAGAREQWEAVLQRAPGQSDARELLEQLPR